MADKITNFEEYKKKELGIGPERPEIGHDAENAGEQAPKKVSDETTGYIPVTEHTMEIEIEDPFQFLDEEEREEYILQRQKERREAEGRDGKPDSAEDSEERHAPKHAPAGRQERSSEKRHVSASEQEKTSEKRQGHAAEQERSSEKRHGSAAEQEKASEKRHGSAAEQEKSSEKRHAHAAEQEEPSEPAVDRADGAHAHSLRKEETPEERLRRRHNERIRQKPSRDEYEDSTQEEDRDKRKAAHTVEKGSAGGRTDRSGKNDNEHQRKRMKEIRRDDYEEDEPYEEEDDSGGSAGIELVVRIASVITGIIILAFIALLVKTKIVDRYVVPEPVEDERVETVAIALPEGYTAKNDTVVVSGARSLNLRTVPSTGSDDSVAAVVSEGDELKRIAVSDDGKWALVDYNGQQLYVSMKYLEVR